jgi:glutathione S-transferase
VNYQHGGGTIDPGKHPRLAAYAERILARPSFKTLVAEDQALLAQMRG